MPLFHPIARDRRAGYQRRIRLLLVAWLLCACFVPSVSAFSMFMLDGTPDHDWTIKASGRLYGLQGYHSQTCLWWGQRYHFVPMSFPAVVALGTLGIIGVGALGFRLRGSKQPVGS